MKKELTKKLVASCTAFFLMTCMVTIPVYALPPASEPTYPGIDVSQWQRDINFAQVKEDGIDVVYIKATEGQNYVDPYFRRNYEQAKANGLKVGFYHFVRAKTEEAARKEADHFASTIAGTNPDCRLAMDFESFGDLSANQVNQISFAFLRRLSEVTGKELVIYSNTYSARTIFSKELAQYYPLWVAQYGPSEPGDNGKWNSWIGFQYTSTRQCKWH